MSIVSDSYEIDISEQGMIGVRYASERVTPRGALKDTAELWFDRNNASWVADAIDTLLKAPSPRQEHSRGADTLAAYEGGPEQQPCICVENRRANDIAHSGFFWCSMSPALAKMLSRELRGL